MSRLVPAPDALVGKRFDVAVAKMLGISRAKAADLIETCLLYTSPSPRDS